MRLGRDNVPYVCDRTNNRIQVFEKTGKFVRRDTRERVASFRRLGRMAGKFSGLHNLAVDTRSILYTVEVRTGKRVRKFAPAR